MALYHAKRLASPGQRIMLYAKDIGCSAPGCDVGGHYCEVHRQHRLRPLRHDRHRQPHPGLRAASPTPGAAPVAGSDGDPDAA
ncbi:hypothetical protein [Mycobacterium shigaense]|uniref:hypothetical protein n=1 Tax=Mycobacterium shigaense TaxID=722731 RepID=UPI00358F6018